MVIPSPVGPNHLNAAEDMGFNEHMPYSLYVLQQNHSNGTGLTPGRQASGSSLNTPVVALQSPMPALNYQGLNFSAQDFSMNAINEAVATSSTNASGISLTWQNSNSTAGTISTNSSSTSGAGSSTSAVAPSQQNLIAGTLQHSR